MKRARILTGALTAAALVSGKAAAPLAPGFASEAAPVRRAKRAERIVSHATQKRTVAWLTAFRMLRGRAGA